MIRAEDLFQDIFEGDQEEFHGITHRMSTAGKAQPKSMASTVIEAAQSRRRMKELAKQRRLELQAQEEEELRLLDERLHTHQTPGCCAGECTHINHLVAAHTSTIWLLHTRQPSGCCAGESRG